MSTTSHVLVPGIATLSVTPAPLPSGNAPQASVSVVVTDGAGTVYPAVVLTGAESPTPWSYAATFASGSASAVATALDTSNNPIGSPASLSFTVTPAVAPQTFESPTGFGFVAASTNAATAALHQASKLRT
jgi:hypothetical protein